MSTYFGDLRAVRYRFDLAVVGAGRADDGDIKPISARDWAEIATNSHRTLLSPRALGCDAMVIWVPRAPCNRPPVLGVCMWSFEQFWAVIKAVVGTVLGSLRWSFGQFCCTALFAPWLLQGPRATRWYVASQHRPIPVLRRLGDV